MLPYRKRSELLSKNYHFSPSCTFYFKYSFLEIPRGFAEAGAFRLPVPFRFGLNRSIMLNSSVEVILDSSFAVLGSCISNRLVLYIGVLAL